MPRQLGKQVVRNMGEFNVKLRGQSDEDKPKGVTNKRREPFKLREVTQLKTYLRNLRSKIKEIMAVKKKTEETERQKILNQEKSFE